MRHEMDCGSEPVRARVDPAELRDARQVNLAVAGMGCANCANRVRNALLGVEDVLEAQVDASQAAATVWVQAEHANISTLIRAVAKAGEGTAHEYMAVPIRSAFSAGA
ncbi:MAG: heavy-metal-associated domain-containing protein [Gemmatimonadota bacterium]